MIPVFFTAVLQLLLLLTVVQIVLLTWLLMNARREMPAAAHG